MGSQRRRWHPTPVLLPGKSHGLRSLVGYSPWGRKELDTTEQLHFIQSGRLPWWLSWYAGDLGSIPGLGRSPGEGKGYPLQFSGLENSMDYTVHGVTKSQTGLRDFHFHFHFFILSGDLAPDRPSLLLLFIER